MKKREYFLLSLILLIGIFSVVGNMPAILADDDSGISANADFSASINSDNDSGDERDNNSDVNDSEDEDNERDNKSDDSEDSNSEDNARLISAKETTTANANCTVRIEKEIKIENGKRTEVIKRKIRCGDNAEEEFRLRIENRADNGMIRERFRYEINGKNITVDTEDEIDLEENTTGSSYSLRARLKNGNYTNIKIMPDTASEIAIARLRLKVCSEDNNCTIQFRERIHNNIPRVVYNIESNGNGRFLGIFRIAMRANAEVDPETGEVLDVNTPWWAFLVAEAGTENDNDANANASADGTFLANSSDADSNDTNNAAA